MFVGDSTIRYQFRSLLYSLHYGQTASKRGGGIAKGQPVDSLPFPSETWEKEHASWARCECANHHRTVTVTRTANASIRESLVCCCKVRACRSAPKRGCCNPFNFKLKLVVRW